MRMRLALAAATSALALATAAPAQSFYSEAAYTGDGSTNAFAIPFTYEPNTLEVLENGVPVTTYNASGSVLSFTAGAPSAGTAIIVERVTPINSATAVFGGGGPLASIDLNANQTQSLYGLQELSDQLQHTIQGTAADFALDLPAAASRENSLLGFSPSGGLQVYPVSQFAGAGAASAGLAAKITATAIPTTHFGNITGFDTVGNALTGDGGAALWTPATGCLVAASFTGTLSQQTPSASASISGTTLTGSGFAIGGILTGGSGANTVQYGTRITAGSGSSWTVSISQTVTTTTITETYTQLAVSGVTGSIVAGEFVNGSGLSGGLQILNGSGSTWVVDGNYGTGGPETMTAAPLGRQLDADAKCWGLDPSSRFNVNQFGAVGNNSTDDTQAINNGIAYLATTYHGGKLWFLNLEYKTLNPLEDRSEVKLLGTSAGDSQPMNGLSSTLNYTGNDAALHPYNGTLLWYNEIADLTIIASNETNETIDGSAFNFLHYARVNLFGNSGTVTKGLLLGLGVNANVAGMNASYNVIENSYFGGCFYCINVTGVGTSDIFSGNRAQPLTNGFGFYSASLVNNFFPNNITLLGNQFETGLNGVTAMAFLTGQGFAVSSNRCELPGTTTKCVNITGSGTDTSGTISGANGTLTVGTLTGSVAQGQQVTSSQFSSLCTIGSNVSGSGSGSQWNVAGCAAVTNVPLLYSTVSQVHLFGNYTSGVTAALTDLGMIADGSDPMLPISGGVATLLYGTSVGPDRSLGAVQEVTATNSTSFSFLAPLHPFFGANLSVTIHNTSGGALGTISWNGVYEISAAGITKPATGNQTTIRFYYSPLGHWVEIGQGPADVPNG